MNEHTSPTNHSGPADHTQPCAPPTSDQHQEPDRIERTAPTPPTPVEMVSQLHSLSAWFDGDGTMRYGDTAEDVEHDNGRRAGFATHALLGFAVRTRQLSYTDDEEPATVIGDLLADLRHLCDSLGLSYDDLDGQGERHYRPELRGEL